ncbi:serine hydrolase domain-containing protein [Congregibacter litoralis]|uniref:Beta-lactamase class C and other penicillin binding protein n=1 Tax=Congregibacter litoralis KT71 TaxID=314285 RepID=A4A4I1_9GAMM|nr:serine hydrolase domain-containing protein [Congregibacter litoralis]EAQ99097.1 Beta-lactamase class C and other penicillin binding protein [Congregibacter litoralis KT71]
MKDRLDSILQKGIDRGAAPGVTAVVVNREGVLYEGGFGERAVGSGVPMTSDTVGKIFSMTKALTAAAAMQLVERGALHLDAPAGDVCPDIGSAEVLTGFDDQGQPITRAPASPVTLRQLLTHTSGYSYHMWDSTLLQWLQTTGSPDISSQQKAALRQPLMFDPGTQWRYGIGLDWAGQLVEAASGMRLEDYFVEHLTGPLDMSDTHFDYNDGMFARTAHIHIRSADGRLSPIPTAQSDEREFDEGGGGLKGTMADFGRFIRMILNDGQLDGIRVLQTETVQAMCRNQIGTLQVLPMESCVPAMSNDGEFFPGDPKTWGLAFQINEVPGYTGRPAGTLMWAGLANSYYWIDRQNGIGGAYLSQILPFADQASSALYFEMETAVYNGL